MPSEVVQRDVEGRPTVIVHQETPEERAERREARRQQRERGEDVRRSLPGAFDIPEPSDVPQVEMPVGISFPCWLRFWRHKEAT